MWVAPRMLQQLPVYLAATSDGSSYFGSLELEQCEPSCLWLSKVPAYFFRFALARSLSPTVCNRMKFVAPEVSLVPATSPSTSPLRINPFGNNSRSATLTISSAEFHSFL